MSKRHMMLSTLVVASCVAMFAVGCKKNQPVTTPPPPPPVEEPAPTPPPPPPKTEVEEPFKEAQPEPARELTASEVTGKLKTVYFDFDKYDLDDSDRALIRSNVDVLKAGDASKWNVVVEGHCDERGTIEYNLALGEKRAKAVRDYMTSLGLPASRVRIVSYGEERPADPGHNEAAWAKNRRAEFKVE